MTNITLTRQDFDRLAATCKAQHEGGDHPVTLPASVVEQLVLFARSEYERQMEHIAERLDIPQMRISLNRLAEARGTLNAQLIDLQAQVDRLAEAHALHRAQIQQKIDTATCGRATLGKRQDDLVRQVGQNTHSAMAQDVGVGTQLESLHRRVGALKEMVVQMATLSEIRQIHDQLAELHKAAMDVVEFADLFGHAVYKPARITPTSTRKSQPCGPPPNPSPDPDSSTSTHSPAGQPPQSS